MLDQTLQEVHRNRLRLNVEADWVPVPVQAPATLPTTPPDPPEAASSAEAPSPAVPISAAPAPPNPPAATGPARATGFRDRDWSTLDQAAAYLHRTARTLRDAPNELHSFLSAQAERFTRKADSFRRKKKKRVEFLDEEGAEDEEAEAEPLAPLRAPPPRSRG